MSKRQLSEIIDDSTEISKKAKMRHSILSEEGTLKYDFMSSLQKLAMAKIVTSLCMNKDVQQEIINLCKHRNRAIPADFSDIKIDIVAKVSQLRLPYSIYQEMRYLASVLPDAMNNWIEWHDDHILTPKKSEYSAVDFIHNITWTTRGKIDYIQTAKKILANSGSFLSVDHQYKLACCFCLKDEIALLWFKLANKYYLYSINIFHHPMVYFWTAHITGDSTPLNSKEVNRRYGDMTVNERIMQLLLTSDEAPHDVPFRFIWNQLSEEEKNKNIASVFKNYEILMPDFLISLFSNLDYDHQQNILKESSEAVLYAIIQDYWWWGKYFLSTALNVLDFMNPESFWQVLRYINERKGNSFSQKEMYDHYLSLFKLLWQEGSMQLKEYPFRVDVTVYSLEDVLRDVLGDDFSWEEDMDVIEVIFKDLNAQLKRKIAFCEYGIEKISDFIESGDWDILDFFIKITLSSEEDISRLKQRVIQVKGRKIAKSFLVRGDLYNMNRFMKWAFNSKEEIANFRQSLNFTIPSIHE